jgi:ADP-ribosyl-[dinitrogen reductase] hydrolase
MEWYHLPIVDVSTPDHRFEELWPTVLPRLMEVLKGGGKVLCHCRAGLGRSGLVAALLLIEFGMNAQDSIKLVRKSRLGAIESYCQERYVLNYKSIT